MGLPEDLSAETSTEIRAEEKSRGGMSYEVILSEAVTDRAPSPPSSADTSPTSQPITRQQIDDKLVQAEQRRKTLEAERAANINDRLSRLEEAAKKRDEQNEDFISTTIVQLDNKLDLSCTNRELHLDALKAKVVKHLQNVESVRKNMEEQTNKLRSDILAKISLAEENRDDHLRTIMAKLQAHDANILRVRESHELSMMELDERIKMKQEVASENREVEIEKKLSALRERSNKLNAVKEILNKKSEEQRNKVLGDIINYEAKIEKIIEERTKRNVVPNRGEKIKLLLEKQETKLKEAEEKIKAKMDIAENNKLQMAEKAKKMREEQERRADNVRANKERMTNSCDSVTLSG